MASDKTKGQMLRPVATFNSSGNFFVPNSASRAFVSIKGTKSNSPGGPYSSGVAMNASGYVEVVPGATYAVVIGTPSGITSFGGSLISVTNAGTGSYDGRYNQGGTGPNGSASALSDAPFGAPTGASGAIVTGFTSALSNNQPVPTTSQLSVYLVGDA